MISFEESLRWYYEDLAGVNDHYFGEDRSGYYSDLKKRNRRNKRMRRHGK